MNRLNNVFSGLSLAGLPFQEMVVLARLILKDTGSGVYYTLEEVLDLRAYNIKGNITSPLITQHAGLGGLNWSSAGHTFDAAVDFNAQNISNIGTISCGAITQSGTTLDNTYQPLADVLTDLAALDPVADNEFIVGSGAGTYTYESPTTVLATLSGQAGAAFAWNGQNLLGISSITLSDNIKIGDNKYIGVVSNSVLMQAFTTGIAINGYVQASTFFRTANGTLPNPSIRFTADPNTGLYLYGVDQVGVAGSLVIPGHVAIGNLSIGAISSIALYVQESFDEITGTVKAMQFTCDADGASGDGNYYGALCNLRLFPDIGDGTTGAFTGTFETMRLFVSGKWNGDQNIANVRHLETMSNFSTTAAGGYEGTIADYRHIFINPAADPDNVTAYYGLYVGAITGHGSNYAIYTNAGDLRFGGNIGFYGTAPVTQNQLATGVGATVDNVITELQRLGLVRQAA